MSSGGPMPNPSAKVYIISAIIGATALIIAAFIGRNSGVSTGEDRASMTVAAQQATIDALHAQLSEPTQAALIPTVVNDTKAPEATKIPTVLPTVAPTREPPTPTPTPEPPTLTPTPETTPPGTILAVRQTWKQGGVELTLKEVKTFTDYLQVIFELKNQNAHEISVEYNDTDNFIASDNRNRQLETCFPYFGCQDSGGFVLQPGESAVITGSRTGYGLYILVNTGDRDLSEVILKVVNISSISEAQWRIPINH